MSGIAGILNVEGSPLEAGRLQRLSECMAWQGPDAQGVWVDGPVGLSQTMLRTTLEQEREQQPCSLDGRVWLTADARIDGRDELKRKLRDKGCSGPEDATDAALILLAYGVWGEGCVEHLLGDFAFAIWDGAERKLFCARDHFGVKPFYYAEVGGQFVFCNALSCLRTYPGVSDELNELAIADFLLFGYNQEPDTTTFCDIKRLPPAHTLVVADGAVRVRRYWTLPIEEPLRYKRPEIYVEQFRVLFWQAVGDRLRTDRVAVLMSGGLDSTAVAAAAKDVLGRQQPEYQLRAYTNVYDSLIPDEERYWSGLAATHLEIPIRYLAGDSYRPWERWDEVAYPEPVDAPFGAKHNELYDEICRSVRVCLTGYGGDPAFYPSQAHFVGLVRSLRFDRVFADAGGYLLEHGRLPPLYFGTWLRNLRSGTSDEQRLPSWLNAGFTKRLDLADRYSHNGRSRADKRVHAVRSEAYASLTDPFWTSLFENSTPSVSGWALELRHPFFDLRLLRFLLRVPPVPWFVGKQLLRQVMEGWLPESVRRRPKTPLRGDPLLAQMRAHGDKVVEHCGALDAAEPYVDLTVLAAALAQADELDPRTYDVTRPVSLAMWLAQQGEYNEFKENYYVEEGNIPETEAI